MLEQVKAIQERVGTLVNWVLEMQTITENPYSNGLNVPKVLNDLQGYAAELTRAVDALQKDIEQAESSDSEKAESASVEQ